MQKELYRAVDAIRRAKFLIFTSGAGMGVDSGLPDFRGPEGFWRAYPALKERGLRLQSMSTPHWFDSDPQFAWGFFGHRFNLYSNATPHKGFNIILNWARQMERGYFAFTSNVDGHLQKAGFADDRIVECHGTINYLQCVQPNVNSTIWPIERGTTFDIDDDLRLRGPTPRGPPDTNNYDARPNILMFGDWFWVSQRTDEQEQRFDSFCRDNLQSGLPFVVIEVGAGLAVPTVRLKSESIVSAGRRDGILVRINPNEPQVPSGHIGLAMHGLEALEQLNTLYSSTCGSA